MRGHRLLRISAIALVAASVTTIVYVRDLRMRAHAVEEQAAHWARQIGTQAEGMVLEARRRGESDPIAWAVHLLAQGVEPRVLKASRFRSETMMGVEYGELDATRGVYDYYRVLRPEEGAGVRLEIQAGRPGFLGSRTAWANDLAVFLLFTLCFLSCWAIHVFVRDRRKAREESPKEGGSEAQVRIESAEREGREALARAEAAAVEAEEWKKKREGARERLLAWVGEAKGLLTETGSTIRDLVKEAQQLVTRSAEAHAQVAQLRERVHQGISDTRGARASLQEVDGAARVAEVLALNLLLAAEKGEDGPGALAAAEELHRQLRRIRRMSEAAARNLSVAERRLEPVATDADLAFHALEEVFGASSRMDGHISRTTQGLIAQARQIQDFRKRAASGDSE